MLCIHLRLFAPLIHSDGQSIAQQHSTSASGQIFMSSSSDPAQKTSAPPPALLIFSLSSGVMRPGLAGRSSCSMAILSISVSLLSFPYTNYTCLSVHFTSFCVSCRIPARIHKNSCPFLYNFSTFVVYYKAAKGQTVLSIMITEHSPGRTGIAEDAPAAGNIHNKEKQR